MSEKRPLTRAEMVRLRRQREIARQMERAAREATRPAPPIAVRATPFESRLKRKPRARSARRRFQIAFPAPQEAIRSIHLPRLQPGWRWLSFVLVVLLGALIYLAFTRPEFRVNQVQIIGNQVLSAEEINVLLNVVGQPVFMLSPSDLETRLRLNYPELLSVEVAVSLPNLVSVRVFERKPFIRWEQGGGYTWIAEDGVAFRPRGEMPGLISVLAFSAPPKLESSSDPLSPTPFLSSEMIQTLKELAKYVPPGEVILYEEGFGFGWNDPRGWRVYFGTGVNDIELKMRVYEAMVNSLSQRGIRPALINVTYPTAPYYRLNQ
ncbi:MAG TPA: FtsQ-type POTRA domain-containing protein [Anaerolineales bacterium]|nr:FtsQ-type POTRA domain-containing protein [Anaerolineales bacterium]